MAMAPGVEGHPQLSRLQQVARAEAASHTDAQRARAEIEGRLREALEIEREAGMRAMSAQLASDAAYRYFFPHVSPPRQGAGPEEGPSDAGAQSPGAGESCRAKPPTIDAATLEALSSGEVMQLQDIYPKVARMRPGTGTNNIRGSLVRLVRAGRVRSVGESRQGLYQLIDPAEAGQRSN
ncbi:hypothetical protein [Streptomyces sp. WZ-12]|uniref:hypothetical protein n=1 Tax=Streptomyces sp. WZ-12 TaxID=3030210 RepID=UPI002381352B|nr:hypothetical protein [Streptomyces sp. WZ-12]